VKAAPPHVTPADESERFVWLGAGLITAAVLAAYAGSFEGPWVFDDGGTIAANPTIRHWVTSFAPPGGGLPVSGRPVLNASFAINYALGGLKVAGYHALNLTIHLAAALTLFGIARRTLRRSEYPEKIATVMGLFAALLWALHPLQTEAVTYISQRAESLVGLFYLLAIYGFIRFADAPAGGKDQRFWRGPRFWLGLSWLACLFGMGTKEVMVTAPVVILLYDRTFVSGGFRAAWAARRSYYAALAATWVPLGVLVGLSGVRGGTAGFGAGVPWWAYAVSQFRAVAVYLRLSFWPAHQLADYGRVLSGPSPELAGEAVLVVALLGVSAFLLWKRPRAGFLGAWFFLILAPSSSVVPVTTEVIAERRVYLPLAALVAAVVCGAAAWVSCGEHSWGLRRKTRAAWAITWGIFAVVGLGAATMRRNQVYQSVYRFWEDIVRQTPGNAGAHNNLGNSLADQGRWDEAVPQFRAALGLDPEYADAHTNLGRALLQAGQFEESIAHFQAAIKFRPQDPDARRGLGIASYRLGNTLAAAGRYGEAADAYGTAVAMQPQFADAHVNFGGVLAELGRGPEAMREFRAALQLEPGAADVHNNLGGLLAESGRLAEAKAEFAAALRLKPDYPEARDNLNRVEQLQSARPGP
jgi:tetratricopeptide (TPR) repeat protein